MESKKSLRERDASFLIDEAIYREIDEIKERKMATATQETKEESTFQLAGYRKKLKAGMPTDGIIILIGLPKSGKSLTVASIPNSILLELERGGADRIDGRIQEIANLGQFRQALKAAVAAKDIKVIGIDSLDVISDWLEDEVAAGAGLSKITEKKAGVDGWGLWAEVKSKWELLTAYMRVSGKLFVLIAHTKEPRLDGSGTVVIPAGLNVSGKGASFLAAQADAIGNVFKKQVGAVTKYFISFQGGPLGIFGSRVSELEDKTIELPKTNQWKAIEEAAKSSK